MHRLHHWQPRSWAEALTALSAGGDGGGGGGEGNNQNRLSAAELLARHGASAERLAEKLETAYGDNFTLREKNRGLTTDAQALTGKVPAEGAVILTGEAAKAYDAYKALGKPDEVKARLDERDTLAAEVATARKDGTLREVATLAGFDFDVLKQLGGDREYELRDVTVEGNTVKQPFIKDGDTAKPLDEFAQAAWTKFLPSLKATTNAAQGSGNGQQQGGGQFIPPMQGGGGKPPQTSLAAGWSQRQAEAAKSRTTL